MTDRTMEIPISHLTFEEVKALQSGMTGWSYPKRNVSSFLLLLSGPQRAAINLYGWAAIALALAGVVLPFILGSWWWATLLLLAYVTWQANRKSMEQFFIENLTTDLAFFEAVKHAQGDAVKVVLRAG